MMNDLVSIIVPVYNVENYLKQCLDSIAQQSYKKLDVILVDDGSDDSSGEICDEYVKVDKRFRVFHQKNVGLSGARNTGIKNMRGKYVCFIDSDDWVEEEYISNFIKEANETSVVCCGYNRIQEYEVISCHVDKKDNLYIHEFISVFFEDCFQATFSNKIEKIGNYAWNKLWPSKSFTSIRYPQGSNYEDIYVFMELLKTVEHVILIPISSYNYRIRENSIVKTLSKKNMLDAINSRLKQEKDLQNYKEFNSCAKALTVSTVYGLYIEYLKNNFNLTVFEIDNLRKILEDRLCIVRRINHILYLKTWLVLRCSFTLKLYYTLRINK